MLKLDENTRVWLVIGKTDMRKSVNGLSVVAADHATLADEMAKREYTEHELRVSEGKRYVLEEELRLMKARLFGKTSEKWKPDEKTQAMLFNEIEMAMKEKGGKAGQSSAPTPRHRKAAGCQ